MCYSNTISSLSHSGDLWLTLNNSIQLQFSAQVFYCTTILLNTFCHFLYLTASLMLYNFSLWIAKKNSFSRCTRVGKLSMILFDYWKFWSAFLIWTWIWLFLKTIYLLQFFVSIELETNMQFLPMSAINYF